MYLKHPCTWPPHFATPLFASPCISSPHRLLKSSSNFTNSGWTVLITALNTLRTIAMMLSGLWRLQLTCKSSNNRCMMIMIMWWFGWSPATHWEFQLAHLYSISSLSNSALSPLQDLGLSLDNFNYQTTARNISQEIQAQLNDKNFRFVGVSVCWNDAQTPMQLIGVTLD